MRSRLSRHVLSQIVCLGTHSVTSLLSASGRLAQDWTADYRMYSRERIEPDALFAAVRHHLLDHLPENSPAVVALDDTRIRKSGRKVSGAKYMRDPLGPPFQVNLIWAQRFLQLSLASSSEGQARTRLGFVLFIAAWSAAAAGHALATGVVVLAILRFLLGLGEAGKWPAGGKAISEWFPKHRRAFAMGVLDGGSAIGAIIAQPMVAAIAIFWGWRAAFLITGLLGFVLLIGWLAIYQRPGEHPWLSEADRAKVLEETGAHAGPARKRGYLEAIKPLLGVRQLWGLMGTRMLATPVWWFYVFWLPDYLSKERGFTLKEIGMFGWIPFLTVDIGKLVGGAASDRLRARGRSARCRARALRATSRSFAIQPSYYAYRNACALFAAEHDSVQCGMPQERLEALRSCPPGGRPDPGSHGV